MKHEDIRALSDTELAQAIGWGQEEQKAREERRKQETIARIKELAGSVGVSITITGARGRPRKSRSEGKAAKNAR
jgi:hypothetical protein